LDQVLKISGVFIGPGPVAVVKSRRKDEVLTSRHNPEGTTYDAFHMVVLCDSETASGAEAVVAALKEHGRATVVGVPTSGKAFIQSIYSLSDGSAVKIGTGMLSTTKGNTLEGEGVQPDIVVRGGTRDTLVECGIQLLKGEVTEGGSGACR
jgi:carboxyl-terminal processing protease